MTLAERIRATHTVARPILFSAPMVRALLAGTKTQTRRAVKWKTPDAGLNLDFSGLSAAPYCTDAPQFGWTLYSRDGAARWQQRTQRTDCPYGKAGDLLWVRETFGRGWDDGDGGYTAIPTHGGGPDRYFYRADFPANDDEGGRRVWHPSIHMPRSACRIELEVTRVRVERLQAISEADAIAEGCVMRPFRHCYEALWKSINGASAWDLNPWVWVVEFRRV